MHADAYVQTKVEGLTLAKILGIRIHEINIIFEVEECRRNFHDDLAKYQILRMSCDWVFI